MRGMALGLLAVLAMVFAGLHAPAIAHDGHGVDIVIETHDRGEASDEDSGGASDGASGVVHHHHCSAMTLPDLGAVPSDLIGAGIVYIPAEPTRLASRAPPPLIDPPSA